MRPYREMANNKGGSEVDLGIRGKKAIVCASSKGLGLACARALAAEGVNLVMNARGKEALDTAAEAIRSEFGVEVTAVAADITTPEGRDEVLAAAGPVDILVNNAGGPPPGMWTDWDRQDFIAALDANMLTPIAMIQACVPGMMERGWGRVVNITSQSVKAPIPVLGLSNSARAGLTGFVAGTSRQIARSGVVINNLLPGSHDTDRIAGLDANAARAGNISQEDARAQRQANIPAGRDGVPAEFGATCAFMCSQYSGYMVGQNVLLDGGNVNSTM